MSTLAIVLVVAVAVAFVAAVARLVLSARSVYRRTRVLAGELTGLAEDLERTMAEVGRPARPATADPVP